MQDLSEAKIVLNNYRIFYPKSLDQSLSCHAPSSAPNHPSVIPINQDNAILRNMNARDYCWEVAHVIDKQMKPISDGLYSAILHNRYLLMDPIANEDQARRMHVAHSVFYRKLHRAIKLFSEAIPEQFLHRFYHMAVKDVKE